mmetsp:Transcript_16526/g.35750  ORF Transcript_16526/g.35750 Transcript_16526/m.35750 type:complete len:239 (-) Transcript_16526:276-992(-)
MLAGPSSRPVCITTRANGRMTAQKKLLGTSASYATVTRMGNSRRSQKKISQNQRSFSVRLRQYQMRSPSAIRKFSYRCDVNVLDQASPRLRANVKGRSSRVRSKCWVRYSVMPTPDTTLGLNAARASKMSARPEARASAPLSAAWRCGAPFPLNRTSSRGLAIFLASSMASFSRSWSFRYLIRCKSCCSSPNLSTSACSTSICFCIFFRNSGSGMFFFDTSSKYFRRELNSSLIFNDQ